MNSSNAASKPIMKWAGGKRRILPLLEKFFPDAYNHYYEPFFGGGAVFFHLQPTAATIADINSELISLYTVIKNQPECLLAELKTGKYENSPDFFYSIRSWDREPSFQHIDPVKKAARTLYLNRTCFNGLYRVNSKNQFNVPFGKYANPTMVDEDNLFNVSKSFNAKNITILNETYKTNLDRVTTGGNFIYLDPPYIPLSATSSFVSYTHEGFSSEEQRELMEKAKILDEMENFVILSNSDTSATRSLYAGFNIIPIKVNRSIGAHSATRTKVGEVLILGTTLTNKLGL